MSKNTRKSRKLINIFRKTRVNLSPSNDQDAKSEISFISSIGFLEEDDEDDFGCETIENRWLVTNMDENIPRECSRYFRYSAFSFPGAKRKDEDVIVIAESVSCYAVCDGHRNRDAAELCQNRLEAILSTELQVSYPQEENKDSLKFVQSHEMAKNILKQTFFKCQEEARKLPRESGTTVALVWLYRLSETPDDIYFVAANAGDARCLLGKKPELQESNSMNKSKKRTSRIPGINDLTNRFSMRNLRSIKSQFSVRSGHKKSLYSLFEKSKATKSSKGKVSILAERLTYDHKATDPSEVERVEAAGGIIVGGCLEMVLQVTRGIGNHDLEPGFSADPFISEPQMVERKTKFLILSSDGIFDKVSDVEAVKLVNKEFSLKGLKHCAISLGNLALRRGAMDDLSCIVLSLR